MLNKPNAYFFDLKKNMKHDAWMIKTKDEISMQDSNIKSVESLT